MPAEATLRGGNRDQTFTQLLPSAKVCRYLSKNKCCKKTCKEFTKSTPYVSTTGRLNGMWKSRFLNGLTRHPSRKVYWLYEAGTVTSRKAEGMGKGINNWHEVNTSLDEFNCRVDTAKKPASGLYDNGKSFYPEYQEEERCNVKNKTLRWRGWRHNSHILGFSKKMGGNP